MRWHEFAAERFPAEGGQLGLSEEVLNEDFERWEDAVVPTPRPVEAHNSENGKGDQEQDQRGVQFVQVSCGDVHSCGLDFQGNVWSWGWGEFGQLGIGISGVGSWSITLGSRFCTLDE